MTLAEQYVKGLKERLQEEDSEDLSYATGASEAQLAQLKAKYPQTPDTLLQLLAQINGTYWQQYGDHKINVAILGSDVFEYPYYLKSVEQIIEVPRFDSSIIDIYGETDEELVGPGIDPNLLMSEWLCFSDCINNGGTSKLYIDFSPAEGGIAGQVIRYLHDPDNYEVIANSFDEYLQQLIEKDYEFITEEE
ncbi:SMI1/KNR4 family protein SUKH-1 [Chitinophaga dinghuensis]|uniref:SMI1/KNR4 family protein SUKH-1 n=1 Tax=Chitinophaga dinghuensis TaxID=1539050 RepID=A0A327W1L8_9BACT|nr:SMI1/KNR4 family protein [Chitinophaga dinghuensis]RAJ81914.1 SMI1/KNR4 family protein SUKH-1 [Chitinophaga dinghuensis]